MTETISAIGVAPGWVEHFRRVELGRVAFIVIVFRGAEEARNLRQEIGMDAELAQALQIGVAKCPPLLVRQAVIRHEALEIAMETLAKASVPAHLEDQAIAGQCLVRLHDAHLSPLGNSRDEIGSAARLARRFWRRDYSRVNMAAGGGSMPAQFRPGRGGLDDR